LRPEEEEECAEVDLEAAREKCWRKTKRCKRLRLFADNNNNKCNMQTQTTTEECEAWGETEEAEEEEEERRRRRAVWRVGERDCRTLTLDHHGG
jgi:hypothetical protein